MNPLPLTRRHRRPRWVASAFFWTVLVLADVAILNRWVAASTVVLALGLFAVFTLRRRRLLAAGAAPVVIGPSGVPLEAAPAGLVPVAPAVPPAPPLGTAEPVPAEPSLPAEQPPAVPQPPAGPPPPADASASTAAPGPTAQSGPTAQPSGPTEPEAPAAGGRPVTPA